MQRVGERAVVLFTGQPCIAIDGSRIAAAEAAVPGSGRAGPLATALGAGVGSLRRAEDSGVREAGGQRSVRAAQDRRDDGEPAEERRTALGEEDRNGMGAELVLGVVLGWCWGAGHSVMQPHLETLHRTANSGELTDCGLPETPGAVFRARRSTQDGVG